MKIKVIKVSLKKTHLGKLARYVRTRAKEQGSISAALERAGNVIIGPPLRSRPPEKQNLP